MQACRDFDNQFIMTEQLINNINDTVKENDILIHGGDWSFGGKDNIKKFRDKLICKTIINLFGNHDHHILKDKEQQDLFVWAGHYNEFRYKSIKICMCHYPFESWNEMGHGSIMLFGHCHHSLQDNGGRKMDVGIDGKNYDFKPLNIERIMDEMLSRNPKVVDHHDKNTSL